MSKPNRNTEPSDSATVAAREASERVMDSAQKIWLAGLGAFAKAQAEGGKWFDTLVSEGAAVDNKARAHAESSAKALRGNVEGTIKRVREQTQQTFDALDKMFEGRVERAIRHLGMPGHEELAELTRRIDELSREMREFAIKGGAANPTRKKTAAR